MDQLHDIMIDRGNVSGDAECPEIGSGFIHCHCFDDVLQILRRLDLPGQQKAASKVCPFSHGIKKRPIHVENIKSGFFYGIHESISFVRASSSFVAIPGSG